MVAIVSLVTLSVLRGHGAVGGVCFCVNHGWRGIGGWRSLSANESRGDEGIESERQDLVHGPVRGSERDRKVVLSCGGESGDGERRTFSIEVKESLNLVKTVAACIRFPCITETLVVSEAVMAMHRLKY